MSGVDLLLFGSPLQPSPSGLTASILNGSMNAGPESSNTFATNTCAAAGGTPAYTYLWTANVVEGLVGGWNTGGTSSTFTPVGHAPSGQISQAYYTCTVTDSLGNVAVSNSALYSWQNTTHGGNQP